MLYNELTHSTIETTPSIPSGSDRDKADEKLTLEEEADLTETEVKEMTHEEGSGTHKGSSGPEEKDIAV
jgi:hypothetical protein